MAIRTDQDKFLSEINDNAKESITPGSTIFLSGTKAFTGPFYAITALTDSVIDVSECSINIQESNNSGDMRETVTDFTIPRGVTIYGKFTSIELDSGTALGYCKEGVTATVAS